nr:LysM and putative peptidoglycan-binding domain-containing protein [Ipomoea batatas]
MRRGARVNGGDCCYQEEEDDDVSVASSSSSSVLRFPAASFSLAAVGDGGGGMNYIEHPVSMMDTLAGVAIRYGVEVTDIKRINGLVSDFQMFALKTLQIPLPGKHPPSPTMADGIDSHGLKLSPAICSLYGIKLGDEEGSPLKRSPAAHGNGNGKGESHHSVAVESEHMFLFSKSSSNPPLNPRRKCRSVVFTNVEEEDVFSPKESKYYYNNDSSDSSSPLALGEKFMRKRQKSESDFLRSPEMLLLKEDECSSGGFSAVGSSTGLALRPKAAAAAAAASRAIAIAEPPIAIESVCANNLTRVRRSSSTSNLQDSDTSTFTSLWPITKPIFDGLPKPITGRSNKAALD